MSRHTWAKPAILAKLRQLHRDGVDLSYKALARRMQPLVSAAAYHFGSYRKAIEHAGIHYDQVLRRPRWTKLLIIRLIKAARRRGDDLHWSAVTRRRDELGRAAFASLQPRLFRRWDRALHAAGLDADDVSQYRKWDRNSIVFDLRAYQQEGEAMSSGAMQKADAGLHAAAVRHFGSYEKSLKAARLDADALRQRKKWDKPSVIRELKRIARKKRFSATTLRRDHAALYSAAMRLFKTMRALREALSAQPAKGKHKGKVVRSVKRSLKKK